MRRAEREAARQSRANKRTTSFELRKGERAGADEMKA